MREEAVLSKAQVLRNGCSGEFCRLIPLTGDFTSHIVRWRNNPATRARFLSTNEISPETHDAWLAARDPHTDFTWLIQSIEHKPLGMVAIYNIDWARDEAEFGRLLIGESEARGKGYAREASRLALSLAAAVGIRKLFLDVKTDNIRAIMLYKKLGFRTSSTGEILRMETTL